MRRPSSVPFVDLAAQYAAIGDEIEAVTSTVLRSTQYILGEEVALFEQEFAAYCEATHAVGVDTGLSALELVLRAYDIGPGDEVVTAANTFIATALAVSSAGARPVLVDIDPETYNMDPARLEGAITRRTKAIIPVHLYGQPADMDPILDIAGRRGLIVIEDACQAHGARYKGKRVGALGHAAAFSFYPAKNLGAYGDGGMVVTDDRRVADAVRLWRNYGQREKYHHLVQGYNKRLDTLQAAALRVKLKRLDAWNDARRRHAKRYEQLLAGTGVATPSTAAYAEPVWHLYVIRVADRETVQADLTRRGVATGIHYPTPIHLQPAYQSLGHRPGDFPVTEGYAKQIISLPMYPELPPTSIEYVAETIAESAGVYRPEALVEQIADAW
jgi:dTDP-4-amino-4,6-dideoxygalactose transaminase